MLTRGTLILILVAVSSGQRFLEVHNGELRLNGQKVFMSGMNIAWHNFGYDFGNGRYSCCTGAALEDYLRRINESGGNSVRIWIHTDGRDTPEFNSGGYITGPDRTGTIISDLSRYLDVARSYNILVFLVLWNGATSLPDRYRNLYWDDGKLQSYIDNALIPMVRALKDKQALGGWEIVNEPEGIVRNGESHENPCFDTTVLQGSGAGWANAYVPMERILRFINWQIDAIKEEDPKALATIGSWNERAQNDVFPGSRNYYTDECLLSAGGRWSGTMDIQQMHTYAWQGQYQTSSPLKIHNSNFGLSKPNIIGEYSQSGGDGTDIEDKFEWAYNQGYAGGWSWQANGSGDKADDFNTQARGVGRLRGRNDQSRGGLVNFQFQ